MPIGCRSVPAFNKPDPLDLKVCNCSVCGVEIVGETHKLFAQSFNMPAIGGRIQGRPLCKPCLSTRRDEVCRPPVVREMSGHRRGGTVQEADNPWGDLAVRQMEDASGEGDAA